MSAHLDLADIQCNVLRDLGSGYPKSRFVFLHIPIDDRQPPAEREAVRDNARAFLLAYRGRVTNALRWKQTGEPDYPGETFVDRPEVAVNLAISWDGLRRLGVPHRTLAGMPPEYIDGMMCRARILGDQPYESEGDPLGWDPAWLAKRAHIMVALNAGMDTSTGAAAPALDKYWLELEALCNEHGLEIIRGHARDSDAPYQDCSLLLQRNRAGDGFEPTAREHFGFTDGFGNPVFEGQHGFSDGTHVRGNGKMVARATGGGWDWKPLATGEFLLGYADEGQEEPNAASPFSLMRNGTFLVYRKLHENVGSFNAYFEATAKSYAVHAGIGEADACQLLKAKMAGRWTDGIPVAVAPTLEAWRKLQGELAAEMGQHVGTPAKKARRVATLERIYFNFRYGDDPDGLGCPVSSHLRRVNTRDSMQPVGRPSSELNNRRRILRRGAPYGEHKDDDTSEHGIVFMALCASIQRQFEFIQQQWLQYGLDSNTGNDDCPLLGARYGGDGKFVVPVDPKGDAAPFICSNLPRFVETRGGEYFFLPSLTAIRMIGMGIIDPT